MSYNNDELVLKKVAWINLIFGIPAIALFAITLFFGRDTKAYFKENLFVTTFVFLLIVAAIYFLVRNCLDSRIKMLINKEGIWTPRKGLLKWSSIHYYYFEEVQTDNATVSLLKIKLFEPDKEIKIEIWLFDTSERDIENAIERNSGEYKIIALKDTY